MGVTPMVSRARVFSTSPDAAGQQWAVSSRMQPSWRPGRQVVRLQGAPGAPGGRQGTPSPVDGVLRPPGLLSMAWHLAQYGCLVNTSHTVPSEGVTGPSKVTQLLGKLPWKCGKKFCRAKKRGKKKGGAANHSLEQNIPMKEGAAHKCAGGSDYSQRWAEGPFSDFSWSLFRQA